MALLLTSLGLYGVLAFSVQRRAREIGIRIALGARPAQVLSLVGWSLALLLASGLAIGVPVAAFCGRLLEQQLFNVSVVDGTILAAALGVLSLAAACAALGPLRTAMRVDPADILRSE
jgi:ABC-type antimicrobial peptide transport system permease subunit